MRVTKLGHACVRIEQDGHVLVLDPGGLTDRDAVDGATAVLITHEHFDHYDIESLKATDAPIFTIDAVARQIEKADPAVRERVTVVASGETFDAGLPVEAFGTDHAPSHPSLPCFDNTGFIVSAEKTLFHPGDALTVPPRPVDVLFLPISAPWLTLWACMDYAKAVSAPMTIPVHETLASESGQALTANRVSAFLGDDHVYRRLASGEDL